MPVIINSRQQIFTDDDTVSTAPSIIHHDSNYEATCSIHVIETYDIVGISFLVSTPEDIQCLRVKPFKALDSHQDDFNSNPELEEFVVTSKDDTVEEIMI